MIAVGASVALFIFISITISSSMVFALYKSKTKVVLEAERTRAIQIHEVYEEIDPKIAVNMEENISYSPQVTSSQLSHNKKGN